MDDFDETRRDDLNATRVGLQRAAACLSVSVVMLALYVALAQHRWWQWAWVACSALAAAYTLRDLRRSSQNTQES